MCKNVVFVAFFLEVDEKSMCYNSTNKRRVCIEDKHLRSEITQSVDQNIAAE